MIYNTTSRLFYSRVTKVWRMEDIIAIVNGQLPATGRRRGWCNTACRLLICACAYAIHHGVLTHQNRPVCKILSVVGEVSASRFDGGARPAEPLHEWLRGRYADDETAFNIDLTACQFYIHLGSCYTGDPCTSPLGANIVGAEHLEKRKF